MPRRGEAVTVIVTSRGTCASTRPSTSSVGRTSYRGDRRNAATPRPAGAPSDLSTCPPCAVAFYATVARYATRSEGGGQEQDGVAVGRGAGPPRIEVAERHVSGELPVQPGKPLSVVVQHRAGDSQKTLAAAEELDEPGLARPVHERGRGHLPEAVSAAIGARRDAVRVDVAVEPEHHVVEAEEQGQQLAGAPLAARVGQGVVAVVREDHHQSVQVGR